MRICLVQPNLFPIRSQDAMQPLAFALLSGATPPGHRLQMLDERLARLPDSIDADLVAISVQTYSALRSYQLADRLRAQGRHVVLGGFHPTLLPEEALLHADSIVTGPGERVWPELLADLEAGHTKRIYQGDSSLTMDGLRYDREVFRRMNYSRVLPVEFGHGCRHNCEFCSIHAFHGRHYQHRPLNQFVAECRSLPPGPLFFVDDNLFSTQETLEELLETIAPLGRRWICQISSEVARDPALLRRMRQAGCRVLMIGFESLDETSLVQMRKGWSCTKGGPAETVRRVREAGLLLYGSFVLGTDQDRADVFERTIRFARSQRLALANFNPLTPLPGTALHQRLARERRLLHLAWWNEPGVRYGEALFQPRGMDPQELEDGCWRVRRDFFSLASILDRALAPGDNGRLPDGLPLILLGNLVSRWEIRRKQGRRLGEPESR